MKTATVVCVALCMLVVLVTDISARPRRGGFRSRTTASPAVRELEFVLCEELVGNMTAVWEDVSNYPCHEDVLEEVKEDEKEQSRVRGDDSSDEDDEEDDDSSDEEGDNSSGEGFRAFSCARCETHGCGKVNRKMANKLEILEETRDILDIEGCPTTTTEFAETTTEQQEITTTTTS